MHEGKKEALKQLQGRTIILRTKAGFSYTTNNILVFDDCVIFTDRDGMKITLDLDEVASFREVMSK